jgi:hypothetical protein
MQHSAAATPDSPTTLATQRQPCGLRSSALEPPAPLPTGRSPAGPAPQASRREAHLEMVCMAGQRLQVRRARRRRLLRAAPLRSRSSMDIWRARTRRRAHAAKQVADTSGSQRRAGVAPDMLEGSLARPHSPRSARITGSAWRLFAGHPCATGLRCRRASSAFAWGAQRASHCAKGSTCAGRAVACASTLGGAVRGIDAQRPLLPLAPHWLRAARHSQHPLCLLHKPSPDPQARNRGLAPAARPAPAAWLPCWPAAPARRRAGHGLRGPA